MAQPSDFAKFDAVEIVRLPNGESEARAYYSHFPNQNIQVGDIGVVIGDWPNNKFRVEAVDSNSTILWQDHFNRDQLKRRSPTEATYSRRRINEHWARQNFMDGDRALKRLPDALAFARKVMLFAKQNVETLASRLTNAGYQFVSTPLKSPEPDIHAKLIRLRDVGIFLPVSLQAWLIEIGSVDFRGTHPEWKKTGYAGINDYDAEEYEPWYTDPLFIQVELDSLFNLAEKRGASTVDIAPDDVTKANVSGSGPTSMHCSTQRFDDVLIGQHGSFTLLSYLHHAFAWGGFPGFSYLHDAPTDMLRDWAQGLTQL